MKVASTGEDLLTGPLHGKILPRFILITLCLSYHVTNKLCLNYNASYLLKLFSNHAVLLDHSQSMWAIVEPDPSGWYLGHRVLLALEKAHGFTEIWANVIKSDNSNSNNNDNDNEDDVLQ